MNMVGGFLYKFLNSEIQAQMKKLLIIFILAATVFTTGCKTIQKTQPDKPKTTMIDCPACDIGCRDCNNFGWLNGEEDQLKPYKSEFIQGYRDRMSGKLITDSPYFLSYRSNEWIKGWIEADKNE